MSQTINLTDEQREFRRVVRQFAEDKIAPHAAELDRTGEYSWDNWKALQSMELHRAELPRALRRRRRVARRAGDRVRGARPRVRVDEPARS